MLPVRATANEKSSNMVEPVSWSVGKLCNLCAGRSGRTADTGWLSTTFPAQSADTQTACREILTYTEPPTTPSVSRYSRKIWGPPSPDRSQQPPGGYPASWQEKPRGHDILGGMPPAHDRRRTTAADCHLLLSDPPHLRSHTGELFRIDLNTCSESVTSSPGFHHIDREIPDKSNCLHESKCFCFKQKCLKSGQTGKNLDSCANGRFDIGSSFVYNIQHAVNAVAVNMRYS